jgi:CHAT domain-containing protein
MPATRESALSHLKPPPLWAAGCITLFELSSAAARARSVLVLSLVALAVLPGGAQTPSSGELRDGGTFAMGVPVTRELRDKQTDVFTFNAKAGQRLYMVLNQEGLDLVVRITTPGGRPLIEVDSLPNTKSQKPASALCKETGSYGIRISGSSSPSSIGSYRIELIRQQLGDRRNEATTMHSIGLFYSDLEKHQKALTYYEKELPIRRELGDRNGEAASLNNIGSAYRGLGQNETALRFLQAALTMERQTRNDHEEAITFDTIGRVYWNLLRWQAALASFDRALAIERRAADHRAEAMTLANVGWTYHYLQQQPKARSYLEGALTTQRQLGDRRQETVTLSRVGTIDRQLGEYTEALSHLQEALTILPIDDPRGKADVLNNISDLYRKLGQWQKAMTYSEQAFPIAQEVESPTVAAATLNRLGLSYRELAQYQKALACHEEALKLWLKAGDLLGQAESLNDLGFVSLESRQPQKAVAYFKQALPIELASGQRRGEASTLHNMGKAYWALGQQDRALFDELAALQLRTELADPDGEGSIQTTLMEQYRDRKQPEMAILFGKQAVNSFQQLRRNNEHLEGELQAGYLHSKAGVYRELAELLVSQNRLAEAEQVLDLLKLEELKETVRGGADDPREKMQPVVLNAVQRKATGQLNETAPLVEGMVKMSVEYDALNAKVSRTPAEERRFQVLDAKISDSRKQLREFVEQTLYPELAAISTDPNELVVDAKRDVSQLQNTLRRLGPTVVGVRTLVGREHTYVIVVTANAYSKHEVVIPSHDLKSKVLAIRQELRSPTSRPQAHLLELYQLLVAPIEGDLRDGSVQTILWSLDGVLRYLPVAALYDGRQYLVERFANVIVTPQSYAHLTAAAMETSGLALAMGLAKSYGGLPPLAGVIEELEAIVRDPDVPASHGLLAGRLLLDDQFTLTALEQQLRQGYVLVHIASHFVVSSDQGTEPYLQLSGGPLTLSALQDSTINFSRTRLLTLSACSTGAGGLQSDGREIDSLGMVAQDKDASAVLATLWDVNDTSTSRLMTDFYGRWMQKAGTPKIEALRQAQIAMLHSDRTQATDPQRGSEPEISSETVRASYAHPYYWAPFVLMGNYQ